jgi:WD40 repeat protein
MVTPLIDEVAAGLATNKSRLTTSSRLLLETFLELARATSASRVSGALLRDELGHRYGKTPKPSGLRKQIERLNSALADAKAVFTLKSSGGDVVAQPTGALDSKRNDERLQHALTGISHERARLHTGALVEPIARPQSDTLSVFFSYAWLTSEKEHRIQIEFFDLLQDRLSYPPAEFDHLPKIEIWRDVKDMVARDQGDPQMNAACTRSFLGVLMLSNKYQHSTPCLRETGFFLGDDGENRDGKFGIVIPVNLGLRQIKPRFQAKTRPVQFGPKGKHLVAFWPAANAGARAQFLDQIADQIFKAARTLGEHRAPRADPEVFFKTARLRADRNELIESLARPGLVSPEIGAKETSPESKDGVPIVPHLIKWARERSGHTPRMIALLGDFGTGKTVACQLFTQTLLERRLKEPGLPLPIYFDLRDVDRVSEDGRADLETIIGQMLRKAGDEAPSAKEVIRFVRERGAIVVFDGLDEITNKLSHEAAIKLYRELLAIVPSEYWIADNERRRLARGRKKAIEKIEGPRIIVSCRTHYFPDVAAQRGFLTGMERSRLEADADIAAYFMLPFNGQQIEAYLKLNLGDEQAARALALIGETYNLRELAERPILLRFIRGTFERIEREKLAGRAINLARLYDIFVDQVFERDNPKHIIPPREKHRILEALALHLHARGQADISNDKLDEWFQGHVATVPRLAAALGGGQSLTLSEIFAQDLRNASLLVRPGEKAFRFAHTSIREYFLANALYAAARDGRGEAAWDMPLPSPETLMFLLQRHAIEDEPERADFAAHFARLMEPGRRLAVRRLAFGLWRRAHADGKQLPRPTEIDLSGFDLRREIFTGASGRLLPLQRSIWRGARLHQAEFDHANLSAADFSDSQAPMSRWLSCQLAGSTFDRTDLTGSLWRASDIPASALDTAQLPAARAFDSCRSGRHWQPQSELPSAAAQWRVRGRSFWGANTVALGSRAGRDVIVSGGDDNTVHVFDLASGQQEAVLEGHASAVMSVAIGSRGGKDVIVSGGHDNTIRIFDLASGLQEAVLEEHAGAVMSVAIGSRGGKNVIVSGGHDNTIRIFDLASGAQEAVLEEHAGAVMSVAIGSRGGKNVIVSGSSDKTIRVFDLASGAQEAVIEGHTGAVMSVAIASRGGKEVIVSGGDDNTIRVFDLVTGAQQAVLQGHTDTVRSVAVASRGGKDVIVSGGSDKTIRLFDLASGAQEAILEGQMGEVMSIAIGSCGGKDVIVSGGSDTTIRVFELATGTQEAVLAAHVGIINNVAIASRGGKDVIVSGGPDKLIRVFDLATGAVEAVLEGHAGAVMSIAIASRGGKDVILSGGDDNTIRVFDLATGTQEVVIKGHAGTVRSIAIALRGGKEVIISGGDDGTVRVFDLVTGAQEAVLEGHVGIVRSVAIASRGGKEVIVTGGLDQTIRVFDLASGLQEMVLQGHEGAVTSVVVASRAGKNVIVSGSFDRTIRVFDLASGAQEAVLDGHAGPITSVAIGCHDGNNVIISGGFDRTIRVFDLVSGTPVTILDGHQDWVASVAITSRGGKDLIVSGGYDGAIRVLELAPCGFDITRKMYIAGATGSVVMTRLEPARGEVLMNASPEAWRDWHAEYQTDQMLQMTEIDDMPRVAAE